MFVCSDTINVKTAEKKTDRVQILWHNEKFMNDQSFKN